MKKYSLFCLFGSKNCISCRQTPEYQLVQSTDVTDKEKSFCTASALALAQLSPTPATVWERGYM